MKVKIDAEEQKIVERYRLNRAIADEQLSAGHMIVSIADQWAKYSSSTECGLTYSEFCNGFNFDERVEEKYLPYRKLIYEGIKSMYSAVDGISTDIGTSIVTKKQTGA